MIHKRFESRQKLLCVIAFMTIFFDSHMGLVDSKNKPLTHKENTDNIHLKEAGTAGEMKFSIYFSRIKS